MKTLDKLFEAVYTEARQSPHALAAERHNATGAIRRHSGEPYIVHPEGVAKIARAYGGNKAEIAAAYLHDTVEDTDTSVDELENMFGADVAQIVSEITNYRPEVERLGKEAYINLELLELSDSALFVKLADMLYNMLDYPRQDQKERMSRNVDYLIENRDNITDKCYELIDAIKAA